MIFIDLPEDCVWAIQCESTVEILVGSKVTMLSQIGAGQQLGH